MRSFAFLFALVPSVAVAGWGPTTMEEDILSVVNARFVQAEDLAYAIGLGYATKYADSVRGQEAAMATAQNILKARAGTDGVYGTRDDQPIPSIRALYSISGVGPEGMEGFEIYVTEYAIGAPLGSAILNLANEADSTLLRGEAGLDSQASANIPGYRDNGPDLVAGTEDDEANPYTRVFGNHGPVPSQDPEWPVHSVDAVPWVGPANLQRMFDHAMLSE